ncbi:hypothetical protein FNV43_RR21996 [Rhamnella rubrinervis]|uniref:Uncharacterized protein n=1 Tax=Rhamnella rubrinervis TaxID=2594499 RepID=A0A8K0DVB2_9ROSA|nr:hypothetical protein FNV43_RR21996 [Rhamnella rubrinervis]
MARIRPFSSLYPPQLPHRRRSRRARLVSSPPFDAHIGSQGNTYARGSLYTKSIGLQYLEAIRRMKAFGFQPIRSIYVSFVPDEEISGRDGAQKFAESDVLMDLNVGIVVDEGMTSLHGRMIIARRFMLRGVRGGCTLWLLMLDGVFRETYCVLQEISVMGFVMNLQPSEAEADFDELKEALDADIQDRIMKEREMQSYIQEREREREVAEGEAA